MSTQAIQRPNTGLVSMDAWNTMRDQAAVLVKSGFLPTTINTPEKAVAIMLKGRELGIPPMHALANIVVISGKPTCNAELMLALIYRDHGDQAILFEESTAVRCAISYTRPGWAERRHHSFTLEEAKQAELTSGSNAHSWRKYPAQMLRARCVSAVARLAFPDTIGGMYTPEELGGAVQVNPDTGEIITVEAVEIQQTQAPSDRPPAHAGASARPPAQESAQGRTALASNGAPGVLSGPGAHTHEISETARPWPPQTEPDAATVARQQAAIARVTAAMRGLYEYAPGTNPTAGQITGEFARHEIKGANFNNASVEQWERLADLLGAEAAALPAGAAV